MSIATELNKCETMSTNSENIIDHANCKQNSKGINNHKINNKNIAKLIQVFECQKCDFVHRSYNTLLEHYKNHKITDDQDKNDNINDDGANYDDEDDDDDDDNGYEEEIILVCSICYAQHKTEDDLKEHFIKDHGYVRKTNTELVQKQNTTENDVKNIENDVKSIETEKEIAKNNKNDPEDYEDEDENSRQDDETNIRPVPFSELKILLKKSLIHKCTMKGCVYRFENEQKLESHVKCHLSMNVEKVRDFKCTTCGIEIKSWRNCSLHMWKSHQIDIDMFKCLLCIYKAVTAVKIWRHMKVHKRWRTKVLNSMKRQPQKERKDVNPTRWYSQKTCEICTRKFANSKTLSKHVKTVHNKIKPFICNVCGRKSARKSTWIVHMRQHTGEKPLQCKTCPFRASDPSVLKKHELRHKKMSQYSCKLCDYKSIQSSSLKAHMKAFHTEEYKKLCCDQCSYVSISSDFLEAHKKDHKKGLIVNEDSSDLRAMKMKRPTNTEISSDCFLPESTDSIAHDPSIDTGGVTIPAHSEDTQFPN